MEVGGRSSVGWTRRGLRVSGTPERHDAHRGDGKTRQTVHISSPCQGVSEPDARCLRLPPLGCEIHAYRCTTSAFLFQTQIVRKSKVSMKVQSPPKSERCPGGLLAADGADSGRADAFESGEAAGGGGPAGVLPHAPHPATRCFQSRYPG